MSADRICAGLKSGMILSKATVWFAQGTTSNGPGDVPVARALGEPVSTLGMGDRLSNRALQEIALTAKIHRIYPRSRESHGAPRVYAELAQDHGSHVWPKRTARMMRTTVSHSAVYEDDAPVRGDAAEL